MQDERAEWCLVCGFELVVAAEAAAEDSGECVVVAGEEAGEGKNSFFGYLLLDWEESVSLLFFELQMWLIWSFYIPRARV